MNSQNNFQARDVFTPTKPARATFVERKTLNEKLVSNLMTPGKQIIVYGHSGSGKTTLLVNKLHQIYEDHITTRCVTGLTFEQIVLNAFDQLDAYYNSSVKHGRGAKLSPSLVSDYKLIKAQIGAEISSSKETVSQRILPPQLTPQTLAQLMGEAGCCWVLEDFHKIEPEEKKHLAQAMKLFMDMSDQYNDLKIIAIGAVNTARQVVEFDAEMKNRVSEIYVPLMSEGELRKIIDMGEKLLNFKISEVAKQGIVKYSNGLASVCHQLCLNICFISGIVETQKNSLTITNSELQNALEMYLTDASDSLKDTFDKAFHQKRKRKYDNGKIIVKALAKLNREGVGRHEILSEIRKRIPKYPAGNLTLYLEELQTFERGAIVRYDPISAKYSFSDPIYQVYAFAFFESKDPIQIAIQEFAESIVKDIDFSVILSKAFEQLTTTRSQK